jgi:hypothetical protein
MHFIVFPVKFDSKLFISVLRKKQLFEKLEVKSTHGGSRGVHGRMQHQNACFWVSFDRYALQRIVCKI